MSSISKSISKGSHTRLKLREMTPSQRLLAKTLIGSKYIKRYAEVRLLADRDCDFDRDCDVTPEACILKSSDVPKTKKTDFAEAFGDSLVVDTEGITIYIDCTWDANNKRVDGVTIREYEKEFCAAKTFIPEAGDTVGDTTGTGDTVGDDGEMVAVPYSCGKGVTMHAWVPKKVAGDMVGH